MPGVKNKLLLNGGGLAAGDCAIAGNAEGIQEQFKSAVFVAEEIEEAGHLGSAEAKDFLARLEKICGRSDKAQDTYARSQTQTRLDLRRLTDDMRLYIDGKLFPPEQA